MFLRQYRFPTPMRIIRGRVVGTLFWRQTHGHGDAVVGGLCVSFFYAGFTARQTSAAAPPARSAVASCSISWSVLSTKRPRARKQGRHSICPRSLPCSPRGIRFVRRRRPRRDHCLSAVSLLSDRQSPVGFRSSFTVLCVRDPSELRSRSGQSKRQHDIFICIYIYLFFSHSGYS